MLPIVQLAAIALRFGHPAFPNQTFHRVVLCFSKGKRGTEKKREGENKRESQIAGWLIEFFPIAGFAASIRQNEIGPY